jgi:CDP-glucose 4,6-dehydratase
MRAWSENKTVEIRSPQATRPWQHVLEPLSGYLALGISVLEKPELNGEAFNFGPRAEQSHTVVELMNDLSRDWGLSGTEKAYRITANIPFHEAGLLKLNCDKALFHLKWESNLYYPETIRFVSEWYVNYYKGKADLYGLTINQIEAYEALASDRKRAWSLS